MSAQGVQAMAFGIIAHYFAHEGHENELEPEEHARRIARDLATAGLLAKPHEPPPIKGVTVTLHGEPIGGDTWVLHRAPERPSALLDAAALPDIIRAKESSWERFGKDSDLPPPEPRSDGKRWEMWCMKCDKPTTASSTRTCLCHEHAEGCICRYWKGVTQE